MSDIIKQTAEKIRRLEVQGATSVATAAIKAVEEHARHSKARNKDAFLREFVKAKRILSKSRETEPLMRNVLRRIEYSIEKSKKQEPVELVSIVSSISRAFLKKLQKSTEQIAEIGSNRVRSSSIILTHCHSSTVTSILRRAKEKGIDFEVMCTETRPLFQGRITARELLEAGIKTTIIVDSAVRFFMNSIDFVLVGADAITSEGNIINKIGTSVVALIAHEARTPFYVASELLKFDPSTIYGEYEAIEERDGKEIWKNAPKGINIRNPVFEVTRRNFIHGIICEEGVIPPHSVTEIVNRKYPWITE
jgi:ribose 1,5-bisphosphate isomerase